MSQNRKTCRTCLTGERELIPLSAMIEDNLQIIDYFKLFMNFTFAEYGDLPQTICLKCLDQLLEVKKFYMQCKDSEEFLKGRIQLDNELTENTDIIKMEFLVDENSQSRDTRYTVEEFAFEECSPDDDNIIEYSPIELDVLETNAHHKCNSCGAAFKYEKNLKMHLLLHKYGNNEENIDDQSESFNNNSFDDLDHKYRCTKCEFSFRFKVNYDVHMKRHRNELASPIFKCPECFRDFYSDATMKKHYRMNHTDNYTPSDNDDKDDNDDFDFPRGIVPKHKKFVCEYCPRVFFRKDSLVCHIRRHTGERPFKCEICSKTFTQKNSLETHMTLHTGKPVKCPICDKSFSRPSFLKVHNRAHTGERPYVCDQCPKTYLQMNHLKAHQLTHTDSRPFSCDICKKAFSQKSTLSQHLFTHGLPKPFKCPLCPMEFIRPYRFKIHMKSVHNTQEDPNNHRVEVPVINNVEEESEEILGSEFFQEDKIPDLPSTIETTEIDLLT